ncbi:MAG: translation initiation factor IF-1 [Patescibacteria group bacterium]
MANKKNNRVEGLVTEALPNGFFRVRLADDREILAHLAGKMRINFIKVMVNDLVTVELSQYDETKGRIVYRK